MPPATTTAEIADLVLYVSNEEEVAPLVVLSQETDGDFSTVSGTVFLPGANLAAVADVRHRDDTDPAPSSVYPHWIHAGE